MAMRLNSRIDRATRQGVCSPLAAGGGPIDDGPMDDGPIDDGPIDDGKGRVSVFESDIERVRRVLQAAMPGDGFVVVRPLQEVVDDQRRTWRLGATLFVAFGGLALLVSPLALPVLAVPVVAEFLQGRHRQAWRDLAALGLGIGLWLALPIFILFSVSAAAILMFCACQSHFGSYSPPPRRRRPRLSFRPS